MSLIYRAYFAFGNTPTTTMQGIQTGAILGFVNVLIAVLQKETPTHVVVAFDSKEKTFRHALFPAYKSHRQVQPESISIAIPYIKSILDAFGIVFIECAGYEADDILGTLAQRASVRGFITYIMTTDKDLSQVVADNVYIYKPGSKGQHATVLGKKEIVEQWKINRPQQVSDILALEGDASDFIPGIPSIGKKTAQKLIQTFNSLENLLAHSHQLTGTLKKNIQQYAEQGILSKQLATIATDVPIALDLDQCSYYGPNREKLEPLLTLLEFRGLKKRLWGTMDTLPKKEINKANLFTQTAAPTEQGAPNTNADFSHIHTTPDNYTLITTLSACQTLVEKLQEEPLWAFAIEKNNLNPHLTHLLGIAFSYKAGRAHYLTIPANKKEAKPFLSLLQPLFLHAHACKVGHNLKHDLIVLQRHGLSMAPPLFDTMIAHSLVAPEMQHSLRILSEKYLNYTPIVLAQHIESKGKKQPNIQAESLEQMKTYAGEKADLILQIHQKIALSLQEQALTSLFYQVEMPLVQVLAAMELTGVSIDIPFLASLGEEIHAIIKTLQQKIHTLAGTPFNISSPKQLGAVLFERLQLSTKPLKTKSGQYATGEAILQKLMKAHPIVESIIAHRAWQKLRSTYVEALPTMVHPIDKRLHTSYQQTVVTTGRLSSIEPNLQNIPIRTEKGRTLRKAFIPHNKGDRLLSADYSQIELRVMAAYTQDKTMIIAFQEGKDIHQITASKLFKVPLASVDGEMRRKAKIANFSMMYGISAFGLAQRIGNLSRGEAAQLIAAYFEEFPGIQIYREKAITYAEENGYVTTLLGRRHFLPDIHARNAALRGLAQRNAVNTPIQGTAAEMIKLAMIKIYHWLQVHQLKSKMIMQVHDELVFNAPEEEVAYLQQHIPELMSQAFPLENVPIKVNCGVGLNWLEAH